MDYFAHDLPACTLTPNIACCRSSHPCRCAVDEPLSTSGFEPLIAALPFATLLHFSFRSRHLTIRCHHQDLDFGSMYIVICAFLFRMLFRNKKSFILAAKICLSSLMQKNACRFAENDTSA